MSLITFDPKKVKNLEDFEPVPTGSYPVWVEETKAEVTEEGKNRLALKMRVVEGEYKNRYIFDRIYITEKAMPRLKHVLEAMGHDMSKEEITGGIELLLHKFCYSEVVIQKYEKDGEERTGNKVKMRGYSPYSPSEEVKKEIDKILTPDKTIEARAKEDDEDIDDAGVPF